MREAVRDLFAGDAEIAVLYFSGRGYYYDGSGYICASESQPGDGLAFDEIMTLATRSLARNKMIILDINHSGIVKFGRAEGNGFDIGDGMTILAASSPDDHAATFTSLLIEALNGVAANSIGDVTPNRLYDHIDQSLGPWAQRPRYTTSMNWYVSLRKSIPL